MSGRPRAGALEGSSVVLALLSVPAALAAALRAPVVPSMHGLVVALVCAGATAWAVVTAGLCRLVAQRVQGGAVEAGPMGWAAIRVAAVVLLVAPFLESSSSVPAHPAPPSRPAPSHEVAVTDASRRALGSGPVDAGTAGRDAHHSRGARCRHLPPVTTQLGQGTLLIALAAEMRRRTRLSRRRSLDASGAIDLEATLLGRGAPPLPPLASVVASLHACGRLTGPAHLVLSVGEARTDDGSWRYDPDAPQRPTRAFVLPLGATPDEVRVLCTPRGAVLGLAGPGARTCVDDAARVGAATGLGRPSLATPGDLERALALRDDDEVVVCVGRVDDVDPSLRARCVAIDLDAHVPLASIGDDAVHLRDGRLLQREALAPMVRALLDGDHDRPLDLSSPRPLAVEDRGVVVRLLTAVPRVDGLATPLEPGRERRAVELLAYLALRDEPVTGERLRVRVLGTDAADAAAKTLFNVASGLRRALGEGSFGPRLPAAGRAGRYAVAPDVVCDVSVLEARVAMARGCEEPEGAMAWLRAALELVESEPFATVLEGYEWFLAEGHLSRLQAICEDAACELVELALAHGFHALAAFAIDRAVLVDRHSERLAAAAADVAAAGSPQASFEAIEPAARRTVPSAPATT